LPCSFGRKLSVELPAAHGALHRVAVQRCFALDFRRAAIVTRALLCPGYRVAGHSGVIGILAAPRLVADFEFVAVLRDRERLRATAAASVSASCTLIAILSPALTAARHGHFPRADKAGILRRGP
jgi:hypothetical protein